MIARRFLLCLLLTAPSTLVAAPIGGEPTLARATFWVTEDRMEEFGAAFDDLLAPILREHGLVESDAAAPETVDGVFSRLYEFDSPVELVRKLEELHTDRRLDEIMRNLGQDFESSRDDGRLKPRFRILSSPAGTGREVAAAPVSVSPLGAGRGNWRTYDVTNGLAGPMVRGVVQRRDGAVWFATMNNGVSRYDGQTWTTYTEQDGLADNRVYSLYQDRAGALWFGTRGGVSRFDGKGWTTFTKEDGLASNVVLSIVQDGEGRYWFGTYGEGVSRLDESEWTTFTTRDGLSTNIVSELMVDRRGDIWLGCDGKGLSRFDGRDWTTYTGDGELVSDMVTSILEGRDGVIWVATADSGVSRYDGDEWSAFTTEDGLASDEVSSIYQTRDGDLWFATMGGGVSRYDGQEWSTLSTEDGLIYSSVTAIAEDRDGFLWFATNGGVSRYDDRVSTMFGSEDGLPEGGMHLIFQDDDGRLWFGLGSLLGGEGGVQLYDGRELVTYTSDSGLADNGVFSMYQDRSGDVWFATAGGASRFDGESFTSFTAEDGLAGNHVTAVFQDRDGQFWFAAASEKGGAAISRYDGESFTTYAEEDGLVGGVVCGINQDRDGILWFGTSEQGVSRFDGRQFTSLAAREGQVHDEVFGIYADPQGDFWFATHGGLGHFDGERFESFTTADGLASNDVHSIAFGDHGDLWIGTDGGGVSHFDGRVFQTLTVEDGLASNVALSVARQEDGALWISSNRGVTRHQPAPPSPPPVTIDAVVADKRYHSVETASVPSSVRLLAFEFSAPSLKTRPGQMVYRYRLEGYDPEWRSTHQNRVEYSELPRGIYTFQVEAVDRDLTYSEAPAQVVVDVHLPYAQIAWGVSLFLAIVLAVWLGLRLVSRDRRLRTSNTELLHKTSDLQEANRSVQRANRTKSAFLANMSHELRTPMNAILGFAELLLSNRENNLTERQLRNIGTIHRNAGNLLELINGLLDLSKIEAGRMETLSERFEIQEVIQESLVVTEPLLRDKPVDVGVTYSEEHLVVDTDKAKVKQIVVNLLSNAAKFTEEGRVDIDVVAANGHIELAVRDTGVGIPSEKLESIFGEFSQVNEKSVPGVAGTGLGLAIAERLCRLLGGTIAVVSAVDEGSTFTVSLPRILKQAAAAEQQSAAPAELLVNG